MKADVGEHREILKRLDASETYDPDLQRTQVVQVTEFKEPMIPGALAVPGNPAKKVRGGVVKGLARQLFKLLQK